MPKPARRCVMALEPGGGSARRITAAKFLLPPLWLILLWRSPRSVRRKILGTLGIALLGLRYAALIIGALMLFTGLEIEWRGGYIPAFTYQKTVPNYEALERARAQQGQTAGSPATPHPAEAYWTGFRGPNRDGHYDERAILTNWPAGGLRLLWRQPIGGGYGSFAIAEGLAFTIEQRRDKEVATAYALDSGRETWTQDWPAFFSESMGGDGPRSTPSYSEGKVYVLGAQGQLSCLEAVTGKMVWSRNILSETHASVPTYGVAASPLVIEDKLVVLTGAGHGQSVMCYDKRDGRPLWNALDDVMGYSSPTLATLAGQRQVIISARSRTVGLNPEDGKLLWEYPWRVLTDQLPIAQPVVLSSNRFMLSAGYFTGCAAVEIFPTNSGFAARTVWKNKNLKNKFMSSIFWQGNVYGLDEDILTCVDAVTGERRWKDGRYGHGQSLLASGHLIILTAEGELALVRAMPQAHEELARFAAITGKTWNYPAIAGGRLLVRNAVEMACFEISP